MPRAHRHFLPDHLWHLTHRCHEKAFLFRFARDRKRYLHWLFEAKKRFGLCVLNYLNMVRAGVVGHPAEWAHSGYREIQQPPARYAVIDLAGLSALCGFADGWDIRIAGTASVLRARFQQ